MAGDQSWLEYRLLVLSIIERNEQDIAALREHCNTSIETFKREMALGFADLKREIRDLHIANDALRTKLKELEADREGEASRDVARIDNKGKLQVALISAGMGLIVALLTLWLSG